jgi:hypothetical protein
MASHFIQLPAYALRTPALQSYTPTVSNSTNLTIVTKYKRVMDNFIMIDGLATWSGAGGGTAFLVSIPAGLTIDTSQLPGGTTSTNQMASLLSAEVSWFIAGVGWKFIHATYEDNTTIKFNDNTGTLLGTGFAAGDGLKFRLLIPILQYA